MEIRTAYDLAAKAEKDPMWSGYAKRFQRESMGRKRTYRRDAIKAYVRGREVRIWLQISIEDEAFKDEFIPIFYSRKEQRKRRAIERSNRPLIIKFFYKIFGVRK